MSQSSNGPASTQDSFLSRRPPNPSKKALAMAALRFFVALSAALSLSFVFHDEKVGGFACLACFMALLSDDKNSLSSRLLGLLLTFLCVMFSAWLGYVLKDLPHGKWLILGLCVFGSALLPFVEQFWWLLGKYSLIFLLISLFDFTPTESAVIGYSAGFALSGVVIIVDHYLWRADNLGRRPMDQLKEFIGGTRNPLFFAVISAIIVVFSLWSAQLFHFMQPAWVGMSVIYLLNTRVSMGFKRSYQRIFGTLFGYLLVVAIFPYANHYAFLGILIVLSGMLIPVFLPTNYLFANTAITAFILFALDWLLLAYGGDGYMIAWRLIDTIYGVICSLLGLLLIKVSFALQKRC